MALPFSTVFVTLLPLIFGIPNNGHFPNHGLNDGNQPENNDLPNNDSSGDEDDSSATSTTGMTIAVPLDYYVRLQDEKTALLVKNIMLKQNVTDLFKYKIIFTIRSRIEDIIRDLFPKHISLPSSYKERVLIILKSGSPDSLPLFQEIVATFSPNDPERAIELFAESVDHLYEKASGEGAYSVVDPEILDNLSSCDEKLLVKYLTLFKVRPEIKYLKTVRVLSKTLLPMSHQGYAGTLDSLCCIQILPRNQQRKFNQKTYDVQEKDIFEFFPTSTPKSVKFNRDANNLDILSIEVCFEDINTAVKAYSENHGWLKRVKVQLKIVSCVEHQFTNPPTSQHTTQPTTQ